MYHYVWLCLNLFKMFKSIWICLTHAVMHKFYACSWTWLGLFRIVQNGLKRLKKSLLLSNYTSEILTLFNLMHLCKNFVLVIRSNKTFKNISFQESVKENWWFGLTASLLAGRVPYMPKLIPGLRQPIENRAVSAL